MQSKLLSFLDKYFEATKTLGQWWESSIASGSSESALSEYILNTYLAQCYPANPEMVQSIQNQWLIFSNPSTPQEPLVEAVSELLDKTEGLDLTETLQVIEEEIKSELIPEEVDLLSNENLSRVDLGSFIIKYFGENETGISTKNWVIENQKAGNSLVAVNYLFNDYLPRAGWNDVQIQYIKDDLKHIALEAWNIVHNVPTVNSMPTVPNNHIEIVDTIVHPQVEAEETIEVYRPTISVGDMVIDEVDGQTKICTGHDETGNPILVAATQEYIGFVTDPDTMKVVQNTQPIMAEGPLEEVVSQTEKTILTEYQNDAVANLSNIREMEKDITNRINQVLLLKEPYMVDNDYVNDSYKYCPSFKNLIEPIQMAIIKKRESKAKEKWFEKYRPELVEEILFPNDTIKETVTEYVTKGRIAGNCMFYGEGGVGKTTTNQVLMNAVLKNASDRFFLDRKIESVDALKGWLNKKPIGDQKIVIAEEFDRLSDAAMTELKNGLLEKYEYVVFLASTNKIHKIDAALLTRFTLISKFETAQISDLFTKCRYILTNERVQFNEEDLAFFIEANKLKGIRTILNNLQLSCYMGVFEPKRTAFFIGDSGTEYDLINWIKWYIGYLIQCPKEHLYGLSFNLEIDENISKARKTMLEILMSNYSLNYDYIFMELLKENLFLPIKNCLNTYYQDIETKRIKSMHFEAMLNEFIMILFTTKDVYK